MIIKGFQKTSLIDFPSCVAAVIFTCGCSFRCLYCHNPELTSDKGAASIPEEEITEYLDEHTDWLDGVVITGGEPTMQEDLLEFIEKLKGRGFLVKLDTNGYNPDVLKKLLDSGVLDYIAMDVKSEFSNYSSVVGSNVDVDRLKSSIDLIRESGVKHEFRTTMVPGLVGKKEILAISEYLKGSKLYVIQNFMNKKEVLDSSLKKVEPYKPEDLKGFKKAAIPYFENVLVRD